MPRKGEYKYYQFKCEQCGKDFQLTRGQLGGGTISVKGGVKRRFCSKACCGKFNSDHTAKHRSNCLLCGKEVVRPLSQPFPIFCSRAHQTEYFKIERSKVVFHCKWCQKEFRNEKYINKSKVAPYCSRECASKWLSDFNAKYRSTRVSNGVLTFSALATKMRRDGKVTQCIDCGYKEHPEILVIHHSDHNKLNNVESNMAVLCPNCHSIRHLHNGKVMLNRAFCQEILPPKTSYRLNKEGLWV